MKRHAYLLFMMVALIASCKKSGQKPGTNNPTPNYPGTWQKQTGGFPGTGLAIAYSFTIGNKAYTVSGSQQISGAPLNQVWEYDVAADKWTRKADYPGAGYEFLSGFTINNKAYVGLGFGYDGTSVEHKEFYEYNPTADKWARKADFGGEPRYGALAFSVNGAGYMGSGSTYNSKNVYYDIWKYDVAADKWTKATDYPGRGVFGNVSFVANGKVYVGLGTNPLVYAPTDFWEYDPGANNWVQKADFKGQGGPAWGQFVIGTDAFLGFPIRYDNNPNNETWKYNTTADTWARAADFPGASRAGVVSFAIGTAGYIGMGMNTDGEGTFNEVWRFKP